MPAASVIACSSAMPTSKKRFGYALPKALSPVPDGMAAVMARMSGRSFASSMSALLKTAVYDGAQPAFFADLPVLGSKQPTPWNFSGACSAGR